MSWDDFKFMMIQEFCPSHQTQKSESELWNHAMVGVGHAAYTYRFHELDRNHRLHGSLHSKGMGQTCHSKAGTLLTFVTVEASSLTLNIKHNYKFPENNFEALKLLENSAEVLKILENKLESMKILENKLESEGIATDFMTKLPRTSSGHDTIWVIVDRLTKSAHFLLMRDDYKMDRLARLYFNEIVARHDMSITYHPQTDSQGERTIQTLEDMLRAFILDFDGSCDVHLPLKVSLPIMWAKVGEGQLIGHELVQETTKKISQIKDRLKAARDRQKSYVDKRRKPLEFSVGDYVLLKVFPWKGVLCESNSHYGYECSQRVPLVYEPESCYIQNFNDNDYSHDFPSINPLIDHHCCYECGNSLNDFFCPHGTCEFCGNSAHVGYNCPAQVPSLQTLPSFPQQYPCCKYYGVTHEPYQCQPKNHDYYNEQNSCYDSDSFGFDHGQPPRHTEEEKRIEEERTANAQYWKIPVCYDDDDNHNYAITPNKPIDSLSMGDEHLDTIPGTESDEFIKSCVENLVPNPNESEGENGCDVLACFTTFSNILFEADYESDSSDYQSCFDEDFSEEIFSNPLFEEEIIPMKIDQHHFNAESDLIESMLNHDSSIIPSSSKIDSLLDEFANELTLLKSISPKIDKTDCYPEEEIHLTKRLLYDNLSPRPPEELFCKNSDADIESFSPSPISDEDSDSHMEEIDLTFTPDDPMPPSIEDDVDNDSERDILDNYSLSFPINESFYFDIPSFSRPPTKPPDGNTGILNIKMMSDVSDQKVPIPGLTITCVPKQEKSPDLLSHRGLEFF
nr:reverse transcriptase domain-containing protein [Tanacetum cinerariifolium]